eukprot:CAMPEP_0184671132 /NCGR_PEP_ID=MMETSP0308-20130426/85292_1 /TAXON_ID=38269 /ORGANISM="Gloeochaete witrockiana, Strain SAG 46.84" /LENGTH=469 /DNA_ID=CAMNT_0027118203 /DNA_START=96 /DNA_END=1505 /DNA_ORIENTATION=-
MSLVQRDEYISGSMPVIAKTTTARVIHEEAVFQQQRVMLQPYPVVAMLPPVPTHPFWGTYSYGASRYNIVEELGHGAYGLVAGGVDLQTGERVAIKHITHVFDSLIDAKRILREIFLLKRLQHENIISLRDILVPQNPTNYNDLFIVFERLDTDLLKVIQSNQYLSIAHVQHFMYQMLKGIKYLHSADIIHRDLKPANVLLNKNCELKICDFGMARGVSAETPMGAPNKIRRTLSAHVVTRWYRAPEVILQQKDYTQAIDVWSAGCVMAELLEMLETAGYANHRRPLFPGSSCYPMSPQAAEYYDDQHTDQLEAIFQVIGTPSEEEINRVRSVKTRKFLREHPYKRRKPFNEVFPGADPQALDLLQRMLAFDAANRCSIDEALRHPFVRTVRKSHLETTAPASIECDFEELNMSAAELRERIYREIVTMDSSDPRNSCASALSSRKRKAVGPNGGSDVAAQERAQFAAS